VIWHSENPKPFKHIRKQTLSLHYKINKSWMTQLFFQGTLLNCYASEMGKDSLVNNISLKFCLYLRILPDILILLVIFILISKWCFSLHTPPL